MAKFLILTVLILTITSLVSRSTLGQSNEFIYQGNLTDGVNPANGNYDFEFALFDTVTFGTQLGSSLTRNGIAVANGVFIVALDFGAQFSGAERFLEIRVRTQGGGALTLLSPRQVIRSSPYAIRSINATNAVNATNSTNSMNSVNATNAVNSAQLGGIAANQYVLTGDARMADARSPLPGSSNYIQNSLLTQAASNFNISGTGSANVINATSQFNLNGIRVLTIPGSSNIVAGVGAGHGISSGGGNSFFGMSAGQSNSLGSTNSFFGSNAGRTNFNGNGNSFFGQAAGYFSTGSYNAFFGTSSGESTTTGGTNAFFGTNSGQANTEGSNNAFFGTFAGDSNTVGSNNTAIGYRAQVIGNGTNNATAIGSWALVGASNSLVLGSVNGVNGATADTNVGIGTSAPSDRLHVFGIIRVNFLGSAGATQLCQNTEKQISTCSSSLRYKTRITDYSDGLSLVYRLRPISFDWKDGGKRDVGFGAEDIAAVDPSFVTYNDQGDVEGVKYDRLSVLFVNAFKEQQRLIEVQEKRIADQEKSIEELREQIAELKALVMLKLKH